MASRIEDEVRNGKGKAFLEKIKQKREEMKKSAPSDKLQKRIHRSTQKECQREEAGAYQTINQRH